jgi:phage FluMu protein Com
MDDGTKRASESNCGSQDYRCQCGSLMAKITPQGVEVKCRRCKRIQIIPNSQVTWEGFTGSAKAFEGAYS